VYHNFILKMEEEQSQPIPSTIDEIQVNKPKRVRKSPAVLVGSKKQVWEGKADITGGKLKKDDLMECPKTKKIISKKKHLSGLALMERARKAKEDPEDPLHEKFSAFFQHQYKKKPASEEVEIQEPVLQEKKKPRKKKEKKVAFEPSVERQ
jgi:hypothetical protein